MKKEQCLIYVFSITYAVILLQASSQEYSLHLHFLQTHHTLALHHITLVSTSVYTSLVNGLKTGWETDEICDLLDG